jgi:hypothetical protein
VPDRKAVDDANEPAGADEGALAIVARHALHDEELIAAFAAGALDGEDEADERSRAASLVERCPACRAVQDDVAAIVSATRTDASFAAKAPRDYRLSVDDAQRLGGTVITRGPVWNLRRVVLGVARPLGASVAALGLVGVLVGSAAMGAAGLASGPAEDGAGRTQSGAGAPSAAAAATAAAAPSTFEVAVNPGSTPRASERIVLPGPIEPGRDAASSPTAWLFLVSVLAVVGGVALFLFGTKAASTRRTSGTGPPTRSP